METIQELFALMDRHGERTAIVKRNTSISYKNLIQMSCKLASGLKKVISPGDKIAVWLPNSIEWIVVELAAGLIGATVVTLNPRYKKQELSYILKNSNSKMLIFKPYLESYNYAKIVGELMAEKDNDLPDLKYAVSSGQINEEDQLFNFEYLDNYIQTESHYSNFKETSDRRGNILNIMYTSGTTSAPKGVMIAAKAVMKHANNVANYLNFQDKDIVLGALPFCGIFGLNTLFSTLASGAAIIPIERYKPIEACELIAQFGCTIFIGVDGMVTPLFKEEHLKFDLSSMRIGVFGVFSSNNRMFIEQTEKIFPNMKVVQPYGMTEVCSMVFVGDLNDPIERRSLPGGKLVSHEIRVEIVDRETGEILPSGAEGEIVISGYNVMKGYYQNAEKTKEAFRADGMFKTGDLGYKLADGTIVYKGRIGDALRLKGFLVSPKEIEDYICQLNGVEIAQVVHVKKEDRERLVAFVKLKEGKSLTGQEIIGYCREGLADFKCPQEIIFVNDFPTTAGSNGEKIQKGKLKEMAMAMIQKQENV